MHTTQGSLPVEQPGWSLSSVDAESTHGVSGDKPSVAGTLRVLPTQASDVYLQCPSFHTATEQANLNKRPPLPPCVRAEVKTLKRPANRSQIKGTALKVLGATD